MREMREVTKDEIRNEIDEFESALKNPGFPELFDTVRPSILADATFVLAITTGGCKVILTGKVAEVSYQHTSIFITLQTDGKFIGKDGTFHYLRGFFYDSYGPLGWIPDFVGGRIPEGVYCQIKFFVPYSF